MLTETEMVEVRKLANEIRALKEAEYNAITWETAKEKIVTAYCKTEDDYYRKIALLGYFLDEERSKKTTDLSIFLESLDQDIEDLKRLSSGYAISTVERFKLRQQIQKNLDERELPLNGGDAYSYCQLLIQKAFTTKTLDQLLLVLCDLSVVLQDYYPKAYIDAQTIAEHHRQIGYMQSAASTPMTKKELAAKSGVNEAEVGLIMSRLSKLGIFEAGKRGRLTTYKYVRSTFDTNLLRKEWDWLWSIPYKKLESYESSLLGNKAPLE